MIFSKSYFFEKSSRWFIIEIITAGIMKSQFIVNVRTKQIIAITDREIIFLFILLFLIFV
jgi:hypothetical protein